MAPSERIVRSVWALALGLASAGACALEPEVALLQAARDDAVDTQVLAGRRDGEFRPADATLLRIEGGPRRTWLRLRYEVPEGDPHRDPLVLRFERLALDRIQAHLPPGGEAPVDGFFEPGEDSLGPNSFAFELPHPLSGPQTVYVAVDTRAFTTLEPRIVPEREFHRAERRAAALLGATYASLGVLVLTSLVLSLALRDRIQLLFALFTSAIALVLLAVNGHLYRLGAGAALAPWGSYGIYALALVAAALSLEFTRAFLALDVRTPRLARGLVGLRWGVLALALVCLLDLEGIEPMLLLCCGIAVVVVALANVLASVLAWHRGEALARAYGVVWLMLGAAVALRVGLAQGWLPQHPATLYGFQLALAFGMFLLSVGLADRVMEFRKQRDRTRQQKELTDASLQQEQGRRAFVDSLRAQLQEAGSSGDVAWVTFRRLLATLRTLVPQRAAAVLAEGYHGQTLHVAEPGESAERFAQLLQTRGARLRNLCRGRAPAHMAAEERRAGDPDHDGPALHYAVLPLPLEHPAWGALLIEREPGLAFTEAEQRLAAEFLALACEVAEEGCRQVELRRHAERDPLTGANNRRSGDASLESGLHRAIAAHEPFALLFVDIDHFKKVNDTHGHHVGDECLRAVAEAVRAVLRNGDELVRWGGEEFLVIAPRRAPPDADALGESIRQAVQRLRIPNGSGELRVTVSIGVAGRLPGESQAHDIVERADRALYEAKHAGRNRVQSAPTYGYGDSGKYEPPPKLSL